MRAAENEVKGESHQYQSVRKQDLAAKLTLIQSF